MRSTSPKHQGAVPRAAAPDPNQSQRISSDSLNPLPDERTALGCRSAPVSRVLCPFGRRSFLWPGRLLAGSSGRTRGCRAGNSPSYLALHRVGFGKRARLPVRRWALTPPFHPYPRSGRYVFCATFRGSLRAAVSGHRALWSPDFPPLAKGRSPGALRQNYCITEGCVALPAVLSSLRNTECADSLGRSVSGDPSGFR